MLASLPTLRQELAIAAGPRLADGQPSWTLHDPVRNLFFQLDWPSFEMLSRWDLREPQAVLAEIARDTALQLDGDALEGLLAFLREQQLLQPGNGAAAAMAAMRERQRGNWHQWLLHNYLFFRIPLLRPDRWLTWLQPRLAFLFGRTFRRLTFAAGVLGLAGVYREWDHFSATLMDTLSWNGALLYGCAIAFAKTCHEMGHALTAKRYGCRVPTMGLAFLVMWPVAYTDTNEVWKLADRGQRLAVASAGIATELCIAVWATLAWAWLPEGGPRQVAFLLSTTTWITTLAINASPFMRFDGYYMLSDFLGLPNLHGRAFALARWDLRERLFAFGEPVPEVFSRRLHAGLIVFAWAVWIYRLVLFLGIAALVYHFFIKAVGIVLFAVEMGWFVALPVWREVQAWRARGPALRRSRRARRSAVLAALVVLAFFVPWPARVNTSGLLLPQTRQALYAPPSAMLEALPVADGQAMRAGQPLLRLASPELDLRAGEAGARQHLLAWQSASSGLDAASRKGLAGAQRPAGLCQRRAGRRRHRPAALPAGGAARRRDGRRRPRPSPRRVAQDPGVPGLAGRARPLAGGDLCRRGGRATHRPRRPRAVHRRRPGRAGAAARGRQHRPRRQPHAGRAGAGVAVRRRRAGAREERRAVPRTRRLPRGARRRRSPERHQPVMARARGDRRAMGGAGDALPAQRGVGRVARSGVLGAQRSGKSTGNSTGNMRSGQRP
jgi:putative peptide zinc metalloprotease protein